MSTYTLGAWDSAAGWAQLRAHQAREAELDAEQEAADAAIEQAEDQFLDACFERNATANADFAKLVTEYLYKPQMIGNLEVYPMRPQTVSECMFDALEFESAGSPQPAEVMQVLLDVAYGSEDQSAKARALVERMAATWAKYHAEV